ncbi:uncharacterized protein PWA37_005452 [Arxiozyma heterogenica]|uniref:uncharacterized protein n=1 Tax=Arxiozyma heterogenica TaxID=278026 RepID=UPI002F097EA6
MPRGTIKATVLIETLPAAFQMEEIMYQIRQHSSGLNCGRWDYIFSTIKKLRNKPENILPNQDQVTMKSPFMEAYVRKLINTCHRRGVHATGGMAAQIPINNNSKANDAAMEKVRQDKIKEMKNRHDGIWIALPALAPICNDVFADMGSPNQLYYIPEISVGTADLLNTRILGSKVAIEGIRINLNIGLQYMEAWLRGFGYVPITNLMEDADIAEVSRCQFYQWVCYDVLLDNINESVKAELTTKILKEEVAKLVAQSPIGDDNKFELSAKYLLPKIRGEKFSDFLTTLLYDEIIELNEKSFDCFTL